MASSTPWTEPPLRYCPGCKRKLPATGDYWFFRAGAPYNPCRDCRADAKTQKPGPHGYVEVSKVYSLMRELIDRCGSAEAAANLSGINPTTIRQVIARERPYVQKRTVRLMVLALYEQRKLDRINGASKRFLAARKKQGELENYMDTISGY